MMLQWRKGKSAEPGSSASRSGGPPGGSSASANPPGSGNVRLGEMLVREGLITQEDLERALLRKKEKRTFLGQTLVDMDLISQNTLISFLVKQCKIPHLSLLDYEINEDVLRLIPEEVCARYRLVPIDKLGRILTVAMVDPLDIEALEAVRELCPDLKIKPILCDWDHYDLVTRRLFARPSSGPAEITASSLGLPANSTARQQPAPEPQDEASSAAASTKTPASAGSGVEPAGEPTPHDETPGELAPQVHEEPAVPASSRAESRPEGANERESGGGTPAAAVPERRHAADERADQRGLENANTGDAGHAAAELSADSSVDAGDKADHCGLAEREEVDSAAPERRPSISDAVETGGLNALIQEQVAAAMQRAFASLPTAHEATPAQDLAERLQESIAEAMGGIVKELAAADRQEDGASENRRLGDIADLVGRTVQAAIAESLGSPSATPPTPEAVSEEAGPPPEGIEEGASTPSVLAQGDAGRPVQDAVPGDSGGSPGPAASKALEPSGQAASPIDQAEKTEIANAEVAEAAQHVDEAAPPAEQATATVHEPLVQEAIAEAMRQALSDTSAPEGEASLGETDVPIAEEPEREARTGMPKYGPATILGKAEADAVSDVAESDRDSETARQRARAALESETPLEQYTFDSFLPGKGNAFPLALSKAIAAAPGEDYNPFYLYGDVGIGKTHVTNAIGNAVLKSHPGTRVGYVSAGRFCRRIADAIQHNQLDQLREHYLSYEVFILDDVQFLPMHERGEVEFYQIFSGLYEAGRQIILSADRPPDDLYDLDRRLVSRFSGGVVAGLLPPDWQTRMAILRSQVSAMGSAVPDDILALIATRVPNDVRKLCGSLRKIAAFANLVGQELTCDLANEILNHLGVSEAA